MNTSPSKVMDIADVNMRDMKVISNMNIKNV